jgi:YidC/Oxa1 family membrane protein insertase
LQLKSAKEMVVKEAKAKELNDKVVTEATVAVATTGDCTQHKFEKSWEFLFRCTPSARGSYYY